VDVRLGRAHEESRGPRTPVASQRSVSAPARA
jgi:hypothetical protein